MAHTSIQHPNAALNVRSRRKMVELMLVHGWNVAATAGRFQVDPKTARKWRGRSHASTVSRPVTVWQTA